MGNLKFVVPEVEETFGNLAYAGKDDEQTVRNSRGPARVTERTYELYSDKQRGGAIGVTIPGSAGDKDKEFAYEEPVKLVNPRITAETYSVGNGRYVRYKMVADDLVKVSEGK